MRLLLDTHAVLWMVSNDPRLSASARTAIGFAEDVYWSIASLWEISIKLSLGRADFELGPDWHRLIPGEMEHNEIHCLGIRPEHCLHVSNLPWHHRDPFDRLLIAQAKAKNLTIVSRDSSFAAYGIWTLW